MKTYYIYKITNPKGNVYIGRTGNVKRRYLHYSKSNCKKQPMIYNSINKYSWEKHTFEILHINLTFKESIEKEIELIKIFKEKRISLNITDGGEGTNGLTGELSKCSIPIIQLNKDLTFVKRWSNAREASKQLKISQGTLVRTLKSNYKSSKGFLWAYEYNYNLNILPKFIENKENLMNRKAIYLYNIAGDLLGEYNSIKELTEHTGICRSVVHRNLKGKAKSYKYVFKYKET